MKVFHDILDPNIILMYILAFIWQSFNGKGKRQMKIIYLLRGIFCNT